MDWEQLQTVVADAKAQPGPTRSSNYRSTTLKCVMLQSGHLSVKEPADSATRDVLMCRIAGHDSLPHATCDLYDAAPSRDLWKAMLKEWLHQVRSRMSGAFDHYYMKCALDRLFAVRKIDHGTISWWPTQCPSYIRWYDILYPNRCSRARLDEEKKFQILCIIYKKLNRIKHGCTFPDALAQTCWDLKEKRGSLSLE